MYSMSDPNMFSVPSSSSTKVFIPLTLETSILNCLLCRTDGSTECTCTNLIQKSWIDTFVSARQIVSPFCECVDLNCDYPERWACQEGLGACLIEKPEFLSDLVRHTSAWKQNNMAFLFSDYLTSVFSDFRLEKKFIDATIILDDSTTHMVHKPLLAIHSPFFRALFAYENKSTYTLKNVPTREFVSILDWIYHHKMTLSLEKSINIVIVADYLDCLEVMEVASQTIKSCITVNNVCYILETLCNLDDLANACRKFIHCHFEEVIKEKGFLKLGHQLVKVILSSETVNVSELNIWEALVKWIEWDKESRVKFLPQLLPCINEAKIPQFESEVRNLLLGSVSSRYQAIDLFNKILLQPKANISRRWPHTLLVGGGKVQKNLMTYDLNADQWLDMPMVNSLRGFIFSMQAIGTNIFLVGVEPTKEGNQSHRSHAMCLDARTGVMKKISPMDEIRFNFCITAYNGRLYCFGGQSGFHLNLTSAETYDPVQNQWDEIPSMSCQHTLGASAAHKGHVYVAGGLSEGNVKNVVECFNPEAMKWTKAPKMIFQRQGLSLVSADGELYALGGRNSNRVLSECEKLGSKNSWELIPPMNFARSYFGAVVVNGKIIVAGGFCDALTRLSSVEMFDPQTQTWTNLEPMTSPRSQISMCFFPDLNIKWLQLEGAKVDEPEIEI